MVLYSCFYLFEYYSHKKSVVTILPKFNGQARNLNTETSFSNIFWGGFLLSCKAIPSQQYQLSLRISYYCVAVKSKKRGVKKKRKRKDRIREKRKDSRKDLEETAAQCSLVWCFINLASKGLLFITHVCLQHTNMLCCW